jgi:hypothetical protein
MSEIASEQHIAMERHLQCTFGTQSGFAIMIM